MEALAMQQTYSITPPIAGRVLIADDQKHIVEALQLLLKGVGFLTEVVNDPAHLLRAVEADQFDAVLMDLNYTRDTTSGAEGLDLLSQIRSMNKLLPVVVLTGWGSLDLAVEAMRRGASDFVQKPWENLQLLQKLQDQISRARAERGGRRQGRREPAAAGVSAVAGSESHSEAVNRAEVGSARTMSSAQSHPLRSDARGEIHLFLC